MALHPGTYTVYNEDGSVFTWGPHRVRVEITTHRTAILHSGDIKLKTLSIPSGVSNLSEFDVWITRKTENLFVAHVSSLYARLCRQQECYRSIIDERANDRQAFISGSISVEAWLQRFRKSTAFMHMCEEVQSDLRDKLIELTSTSEYFVIIFSEIG